MQQTTTKQNTFGTLVLEQVWSRLGKNYRYPCNEYYQLAYPLREFLSDYYPFGSSLPTRSWSDASRAYRYGFNGKEKDSETANDDYDFGARIYDARLGRWLSVDPDYALYPGNSPYFFCFNNPLNFVDRNGKKIFIYYQVEATYDDGTPVLKFNPETGEYTQVLKTVYIEYKPGMKVPNNKFVKQAVEALDYIMENSRKGRRQIIKSINASEEIKLVQTTSLQYSDLLPFWDSEGFNFDKLQANINASKLFHTKFGFWPCGFTIYWNPNSKTIIHENAGWQTSSTSGVRQREYKKTNNTLSAAMGLMHELIHNNGAIKNYIKSLIRFATYDDKYDTKEERRTIRLERAISSQLKENKRYNHNGTGSPNNGVSEHEKIDVNPEKKSMGG